MLDFCFRHDASRLISLVLERALKARGVETAFDPDEMISPASEVLLQAATHIVVVLTPAALHNQPSDERLMTELKQADEAGLPLIAAYACGAAPADLAQARLPASRTCSTSCSCSG